MPTWTPPGVSAGEMATEGKKSLFMAGGVETWTGDAYVEHATLACPGGLDGETIDRPRPSIDAVVGVLFIGLGTLIGWATWFAHSSLIQSMLVDGVVPQWREYAQGLQQELWTIVALRALPFVIVGGLVLLPFNQQRRRFLP